MLLPTGRGFGRIVVLAVFELGNHRYVLVESPSGYFSIVEASQLTNYGSVAGR